MALIEIINTVLILLQFHKLFADKLQTIRHLNLIFHSLFASHGQAIQHTITALLNFVQHSLG
jgi:uncharacterized membrane protein